MEEKSSATVGSTKEETEESSKAGKDTEVESIEVEKASKTGDAERGADSGDVGSSAAFGDDEKTFENTAAPETADSLASERATENTELESNHSTQKASENVSEYSGVEKSGAGSTAGDSTTQKSNQSNTRGEENVSEYSQSQKSGNPAGRTAENTLQKTCGYQCSPVTSEEIVEDVVCNESDLKENEMQTFDLGGLGDIVVVRQRGQIYAVCNECTHYGAPLSSGALSIGRIRCPWHGACFNLATGDIEDFPGLDDLPSLTVSVQPDGGVKVQALRKDFENKRRSRCKATVKKSPELDSRIFVVAGGGPAGQVCAETLREGGFRGKLIMLAAERYFPYERVMLSKALLTDTEGINLRPKHFYKKYDIDLKIGVALVSLNTKEKLIEVSTGEKMSYDSIFLATGAGARKLSCPGSDLKKIFVLRTLDDTKQIDREIKANVKLVVVGASFIGMECAAHCIGKNADVTVVGIETVPFELQLGPQIGAQVQKWFEEKGVKFIMSASVAEILPSENDPSCVGQVKLEDGRLLVADVIVLGIGVIFDTKYLQNSGVTTEGNGTIPVNDFLETNVPGVFAGGDIAFAPVLGTVAAIGHWQLAHYHGRIAGRNMLGKKEPLRTVPFFWTALFDKGFKYAGFVIGFDDIVLHGNLDDMDFIAYFCKGESVLSIAASGNDPIVSQFAELLHSGKKITKAEVQESPTAWTGKLLE